MLMVPIKGNLCVFCDSFLFLMISLTSVQCALCSVPALLTETLSSHVALQCASSRGQYSNVWMISMPTTWTILSRASHSALHLHPRVHFYREPQAQSNLRQWLCIPACSYIQASLNNVRSAIASNVNPNFIRMHRNQTGGTHSSGCCDFVFCRRSLINDFEIKILMEKWVFVLFDHLQFVKCLFW